MKPVNLGGHGDLKFKNMRKVLHAIISVATLSSATWVTAINRAHAAEAAPSGEPGLVGCWSFDEGDGNAVKDSSKSGHDGSISGAKRVKGVVGSALEFNGVSDFANVSSPGSGLVDKAVSVEAWIQSAGNNVNANLVFAGPESLDFGIWI